MSMAVFFGRFARHPVENAWHTGVIASKSGETLAWTNSAGVSWALRTASDTSALSTGEDCPYPGQNFELVWEDCGRFREILGFRFQGELYERLSEGLEGRFVHIPPESSDEQNDWHRGAIVSSGAGNFTWTNAAGASWSLRCDHDAEPRTLFTDEDCPYEGHNFKLAWASFEHSRGVVGFWFQGELYQRVLYTVPGSDSAVAPDPEECNCGGLHGYIAMNVQPLQEQAMCKGISWYSAAWPLLPQPSPHFQAGLASAWVIPNNLDWEAPLCPPGTVARDNWPERGPSYRDVFQTIEGGLGFWVGDSFKTGTPKYRINAVPDGYNRQISTPSCHQFCNKAGDVSRCYGLAQLSNRLLVPPDGLPMKPGTCGELLGQAWMALPWTKPAVRHGKDGQEGVPTGDQGWTLFLKAANFAGPLAFFLPDLWSELSANYHDIVGRGHDARPAVVGSLAMEVACGPHFEARVGSSTYTKIPQMDFPLNGEGRSVIVRDVRFYTPETLWEPFLQSVDGGDIPAACFGDGVVPKCSTGGSMGLDQNLKDGVRRPVRDSSDIVKTTVHQSSLELEWGDAMIAQANARAERDGGPRMATLPRYYRVDGNEMIAVDEADVPPESGLVEKRFRAPRAPDAYQAALDEANASEFGCQAGPFTAKLADGSQVSYGWFRFVDQPALRYLLEQWTDQDREALQGLVERVHGAWCNDQAGEGFMQPPPEGSPAIATFDQGILVEPPEGMSTGYVPVAFGQKECR